MTTQKPQGWDVPTELTAQTKTWYHPHPYTCGVRVTYLLVTVPTVSKSWRR